MLAAFQSVAVDPPANPPLCLPQLLQNDPFGRRLAAAKCPPPATTSGGQDTGRLSLRPSTRNCAQPIRLRTADGVCVEIELLPGRLAWRSLSRRPASGGIVQIVWENHDGARRSATTIGRACGHNKCSRSARSSPLRSAYAARLAGQRGFPRCPPRRSDADKRFRVRRRPRICISSPV